MDQKLPVYPSRVLLDQIADKWTILILGVLCANGGSARFNIILRQIDGITQKALTQCLRKLERDGLIDRTILATAPPGVEYSTTPLGHTLRDPFKALHDWAETHMSEVELARQRFDAVHIRPGLSN